MATQKPNLRNNLIKMNQLRAEYTGEILGEFVILETAIEEIIALYFTNNDETKAKELCHLLLSTEHFSFGKKTSMLKFIIDKYPDFQKSKKRINEQIGKCLSMRNGLAHKKLKCEEIDMLNFKNNQIVLEAFIISNGKPETEDLILNREIVNEVVNRIKVLIYDMIDVYNKIKGF